MRALILSALLIAAPQIESAELIWPTIDISPFSFIDNAKEVGLNHDLVAEISKRANLKFKMKRENKAKTLLDMRNGTGQFTFGYRNKDTDSYLETPICLFTHPVLAVSRPGVALKKIEDMRGFKNGVGVILGSGASNEFDADPAIKKVSQSSYDQMFENMKNGKLDAAMGSGLGLAYFLRESKKPYGDKLEVGRSDYCLLVEKTRMKAPETAKVIAAIEALKKEGAFEKIVAKYTE